MTKRLVRRFIKTVIHPRSFWVRTSIAYFMLLALVPTLGILALLLSAIKIDVAILIPFLEYSLPDESVALFQSYLLGGNFDVAWVPLVISLVFSFNIVSDGVMSIGLLGDNMYGFKSKSFFKNKAKALLLSLILVTSLVLLIIISVLFPSLVNVEGWGAFLFPISWIVTLLLLLFLFMFTPAKRLKMKEAIYGAIFSSFIIAIFLELYRVYIKYFGNFNSMYGPLASVIVLLILFDWMATVIYAGISLNLVVNEMYGPKNPTHTTSGNNIT